MSADKTPKSLADIKDPKDVVCIMVDNGIFGHFAERLAKTYKKVYLVTPWISAFPKYNLTHVGYGVENVHIVDSIYGPHFLEADLFFYPDIYFGPEQEHLISLGKKVWGCRTGECLELSRRGMKSILTALDLPVGKFAHIVGMDNLRAYLKEHNNVHVKIDKHRGSFETFKSTNYDHVMPKLDEIECSLGAFKKIVEFTVEDDLPDCVELGTDAFAITDADGVCQYPSKLISGIEIKDVGFLAKYTKYTDLPKQLTEFNEAVKPVLAAYDWRGFFSTEVRIAQGGKNYMIDFCFDSETEVLTHDGWKLFANTTASDAFATLNLEKLETEYQQASRYIEYPYQGKMIHISNRKKSIECLVTPEHEILRTDRGKNRIFKERADSLTDKGFIPRVAPYYGGSDEPFFVLPAYHHEWDFIGQYGHKICTKAKDCPEVKIPIKDWAAFMGWYLSEGSTSNSYVTQISQTKLVAECEEVLDRLPFDFDYDGNMFRCSNVQLATYLKKYGLCDKKYIPDYIRHAKKDVIEAFLLAFSMGDGSYLTDRDKYYTSSKVMADQLQELIFKTGKLANIHARKTKGTQTTGFVKNYTRKHDMYVLEVHDSFTDFWFETQARKSQYINEVDYDGTVHCVTVPNGTLYVRRKGKPFWACNCARAPSPPGELYCEMYSNLPEVVWAGANGILLEPESEFSHGVELMLHSSFADKGFQPISFPKEIERFVKIRNHCVIDDVHYAIPQAVGLPECGAVIGMGNSIEEAMDHAVENAEQVTGYYLEAKTGAIDDIKKQLDIMDERGLNYFK